MAAIKNFLGAFTQLSSEQLSSLISLAGLCVAGFAIYAVITITKERK